MYSVTKMAAVVERHGRIIAASIHEVLAKLGVYKTELKGWYVKP